MGDIFAELEKMGFSNIEGGDLFQDGASKLKKEAAGKTEEPEQVDPQKIEREVLFNKTYECPVCDKSFVEKTIKTGKARHIGTDLDLRPRYAGVDPLKYDTVICPHCGYASLAKSFSGLTSLQRKNLKEKIQANFKGLEEQGELYDYPTAITRFKLTLFSAMVKMSRNSEKAYICLKLAWLYRGWAEEITAFPKEGAPTLEELKTQETEYIKRAYEGFEAALKQEMFPICGMDEMTFDYLFAVLAMNSGDTDAAKRLVGNIIVNKNATAVMKDRARNLKEILMGASK